MKSEDLEIALHQLDDLARKEYRESLTQVATQTRDDDDLRMLRVGRLIGVMLKQPFATAYNTDVPSSYTRAYRSWKLGPEAVFDDAGARSSWQYRALEALRSDPAVVQSLGWQPATVYALAQYAQAEEASLAILPCRAASTFAAIPTSR